MRWFRGNLHTHTTNSDGDSPPDVVVAWYRDAGYDFLALTDHDLLTHPDSLRHAAGSMLLVRGEELSPGDIHLNALGIAATLAPQWRERAAERLQANIDAVRAAGGVPSVNHPNFRWQLTPADLAALERVRLFEVYNGGPDVHNAGRPDRPSTEDAWDIVLTAGRRMLGIATDDAHHFRTWGRAYSNPGRGWVVIRAPQATEADLLTALEAGDFYATTGVELEGISMAGEVLAVDVATVGDHHYRSTWIGQGGRVLEVEHGASARYRPTGSEGYVRARIEDSDGRSAWVQPRFLG